MRTIKRSIAEARAAREERARSEHGERYERGEHFEGGERDEPYVREGGDLERGDLERGDRQPGDLERGDREPGDLERGDHASNTSSDAATCEHVTRELTTRIDLSRRHVTPPRGDLAPPPRDGAVRNIALTPRDIAPFRCEPCPRIVPARRLFDGTLLQHFQCDGTCARDARGARGARDRGNDPCRALRTDDVDAHRARHAHATRVALASRRELRMQIAITAVLAGIAAMWIVLAAREASADVRARDRDAGQTRDRRETTNGRGSADEVDDGARRLAPNDRYDDDDEGAIDIAAAPVQDPFGSPAVPPPIAKVLAAAYRTAGLDHDLGRGFVRRSRLAGLVPWLSVRTGRDTSWRDDQPDVARGVTIEVRATWRLDRLVFDGRELQVAALEAARRRERRRLAARVIQVYFVWKRAVRNARSVTLADEAAAELDDLTDGWFSEARSGPPGALSGGRTVGGEE